MLVSERNGFQRENRFARFVHRFDCLFVSGGGRSRAEMPGGIYDDCYAGWHGCPTDRGNVSSSLQSGLSDADGSGLARNTTVADVDIATARREICPGLSA